MRFRIFLEDQFFYLKIISFACFTEKAFFWNFAKYANPNRKTTQLKLKLQKHKTLKNN